jgi:integral membrane protein
MSLRSLIVWTARLEGSSLLLLFFVAMPLKYVAEIPEPVHYAGWAHGLLFTAFVAGLAAGLVRLGWPLWLVATGLVASMLPFGTFLWERQLQDGPEAASVS